MIFYLIKYYCNYFYSLCYTLLITFSQHGQLVCLALCNSFFQVLHISLEDLLLTFISEQPYPSATGQTIARLYFGPREVRSNADLVWYLISKYWQFYNSMLDYIWCGDMYIL